ncbi:MAG: GAF domain-containing protein [Oleiphilaceae bacterium]|nr:GAF domain-containing protein [Oleiphilaceae bacterium]
MRLSISFKLISIALLITTSVLCGLGFYNFEKTKTRLNNQLDGDIKALSSRLQLNLPGAVWNYDDAYITSTLFSEANAYFVDGIYVVDDSDELIDGVLNKNGEVTQVSELPQSKEKLKTFPLVFIDADSEEEHGVGNLKIDVTDRAIRELLDEEVVKSGIQIGILNLILILLFAIAIGRFTRPIKDLQSVASSIAQGNYDLDIKIQRNDEIGDLAESFTQMKESISKKISDLHALNASGEVLALSGEKGVALSNTLQAMSKKTNLGYGSIFLFDQDKNLTLETCFPSDNLAAEKEARKFTDGEGAIGLSAKTGEIVFIPDTSADERFITNTNDEQSRALICVPLLDENEVMGVLNLSGEVEDVRFEDSDTEFVSTLARQLVTTLKNINLRETIEEHNRTLEQKVRERTAELEQKNRDVQAMLHNMRQGLFTVVEDGRVHPEYSAFLESILEKKAIAGQHVLDVLFDHAHLGSDQLNQVKVAIESLLGEDEMMFEFNSHLLANEFEFEVNGHKKILSLDWNAITNDGQIEKLMVTVRDVTKLKALELEAQHQKRELEIVGQIIKLAESKFNGFISSAREFIRENHSLISQHQDKDDEVLAKLFRNMHTIKGNARTYGLGYLTDIVHEVESTYSALRNDPEMNWEQEQLLNELAQVESGINEYAFVNEEVLGRKADGGSDEAPLISQQALARMQHCLQALDAEHPSLQTNKEFQQVLNDLKTAGTLAFNETISDLVNSLPSIAQELGKSAPQVHLNTASLRVKPDMGELINNVFSHLLRNSLDHGIESDDEREQAGKSKAGNIYVDAGWESEKPTLTIRDDGKGLNLERLFQKGVEMNKWSMDAKPSMQEVADLIFASGISTKESVSSISGRGVGMDAVKNFLIENGGDITLKLRGEDDTQAYVPFELVVTLPGGIRL